MNVEFLSYLYQRRVLDATKKDQLLSEKNARECRKKFLDFLWSEDTASSCPFEEFLKALTKSGQEELRKDFNDPVESTLERETEWWEWKIKIRKFYHELVTRLIVRAEVLVCFMSEGILNEEDKSLIEHEVTESGKAMKLLSILHCKPQGAFKLLLQYLADDVQTVDLAQKIQNEPITTEDWCHCYGRFLTDLKKSA